MMKKIIVVLLFLLLVSNAVYAKSYIESQLKNVNKNVKYNTVQKHSNNYNQNYLMLNPSSSNIDIADPKLIKLSSYKKISDKDFEAKLAQDELSYKKDIIPVLSKKTNSVNIEPQSVDFYNVYRIAEKLIRANNLDYTNWSISIRKTDDVNAYSSDISHIVIYTQLYDTFYTDKDAMAFIIAHEMSHLILGHMQQLAELNHSMIKYQKIKKAGGIISKSINKAAEASYFKKLRDQEYMADSEAIILLTKAGFSPQKAMNALNSLEALGQAKSYRNTHPMVQDRINSYKENMALSDPDWVDVGKENIYNSKVLPCKKSSDRVSIVISKSEVNKEFYKVEDIQARLKRFAYMSYRTGKYSDAVKYFEKLSKIEADAYEPYVYIALANSAMYSSTKQDKYKQNSFEAINKALELSNGNTAVKNIESDLKKKFSL